MRDALSARKGSRRPLRPTCRRDASVGFPLWNVPLDRTARTRDRWRSFPFASWLCRGKIKIRGEDLRREYFSVIGGNSNPRFIESRENQIRFVLCAVQPNIEKSACIGIGIQR